MHVAAYTKVCCRSQGTPANMHEAACCGAGALQEGPASQRQAPFITPFQEGLHGTLQPAPLMPQSRPQPGYRCAHQGGHCQQQSYYPPSNSRGPWRRHRSPRASPRSARASTPRWLSAGTSQGSPRSSTSAGTPPAARMLKIVGLWFRVHPKQEPKSLHSATAVPRDDEQHAGWHACAQGGPNAKPACSHILYHAKLL